MLHGEAAGRAPVALGRPVRLEGYWDRTRADASILDDLVISADGRTKRSFGVTAAQAYKPEEEGVQIFRGSTLQPIAILLRGGQDLTRRFLDAGPEDKVVAFGLYYAGPAQLVLSSVEIERTPAPTPTGT